ncbi:MAG: hypothetical protein ACD_73C00215G0001 [uncultured bacterium]|nr:MAG: hypothetical protein ACD_73C00215G0001 [uncultured bacterium]
MAIRHKKAILSCGYKSQILFDVYNYLDWVADYLDSRPFEPFELATIEYQLEIMELFLIHLWVSPPFNGILMIPRTLTQDQKELIFGLIEEAKKQRRHLKLAYNEAA